MQQQHAVNKAVYLMEAGKQGSRGRGWLLHTPFRECPDDLLFFFLLSSAFSRFHSLSQAPRIRHLGFNGRVFAGIVSGHLSLVGYSGSKEFSSKHGFPLMSGSWPPTGV